MKSLKSKEVVGLGMAGVHNNTWFYDLVDLANMVVPFLVLTIHL